MAALRARDHYLRSPLVFVVLASYRDLEELLLERDLPADHTTIRSGWACASHTESVDSELARSEFVPDLCQKIADLDVLADLVRRKNSKLRGINDIRT